MKHYYQLEIPYNKDNIDKIYNLLYKHGIDNIIDENGLLIISKKEEELSVLTLLIEDLNKQGLIKPIKLFLDRLEYRDWNKEWERSIKPVYIKNRLIITPSWYRHKITADRSTIIVQIDPKMSFGTGHNETTQLVLELMVDHITENDKKMLDYGTGTGILAIAAIKLGLEHCDAIDIDEYSIMNAKENFRINKIGSKVVLTKGDISDINNKKYDIITANINKVVLKPNMNHIYLRLKKNAKLFISGILHEEDKVIQSSLKTNNLELIERTEKGEWFGYYAIRK